ncbi:MAG: 2-succinyl-5-enolpyruvyl-6-hydroxy-3-cyclohexene-1-carboxylic-acid synthase [bacterium]|nr:2-succinyl-5-enolpyruvyl-6-hydroxy-3-cyclohexene-1-carboxylic-acid synthase [bacterium]
MTPDLTNINTLWTSVLIEELVRHGVTQFVISPGSRSTPLVWAVANNQRAESVVHFDERGAAFFALGYGRATGKPAALICTSGTAVANYLPAVIEASIDCVPMILLTADRPPELRNRGANQTITQPGIFSSYPRWEHDLTCPTLDIPLTNLLTAVDSAVAAATATPCGPVHLNCMFREPLAPLKSTDDLTGYAASISAWARSTEPQAVVSHKTKALTKDSLEQIEQVLSNSRRGLLVIGALKSESERAAVAALATDLNWPLIADIGSGLRGGEIHPRIDFFDLILTSDKFAAGHRPDTVIQIGSRLTSKRLLTFLEESKPPRYVQILDHPFPHDPINRVTDRQQGDIATVCRQLRDCVPSTISGDWLADWKGTSTKVDAVLEQQFAQSDCISEPIIAHLLSSELDRGSHLWLASSMPIRDFDVFADPRADWYAVAANRGASGIDGTIASAAGYAYGLNRRVTLLIGDLAMLHDLNSLSLLRDPNVALTIIILNNNGGGIFGHLPIAQQTEIFEKYFITPHTCRFEESAKMFGLPYSSVDSPSQFVEAYRKSQGMTGSSIIEISVDRRKNQKFHEELVESVRRRLERE